jgi:hypothetical protein
MIETQNLSDLLEQQKPSQRSGPKDSPLPRIKPVHLNRGAPCVRSWSKYKATDHRWALCGIRERKSARLMCTEDASQVTCEFCRDLAGLKPSKVPAASLQVDSEVAA